MESVFRGGVFCKFFSPLPMKTFAETISLPVLCDVSIDELPVAFKRLFASMNVNHRDQVGVCYREPMTRCRTCTSSAAVGGHTVHNFLDVTTNYLLNPWSTLVSFGETPQQIHPGTCRPGLHAPDHCFKLRVKTSTLAISEKWKLVDILRTHNSCMRHFEKADAWALK